MSLFFLFIEIFILLLAAYVLIQKQELAVLYVPVIVFSRIIGTPVLPLMVYYGLVSLIVIYLIYRNNNFFKENPWSFVLILLYLVLLTSVSEFEGIRSAFFPMIWLFLLIPLVSAIYRKYPRDMIVQELSTSALLILLVFIANVLVSTYYGYSPKLMYGITTGVLYGNLYATDFNVLAIALFVVLLRVIQRKNLFYFATFLVSFAFIMLSFRRSVMGLSILGIGIALMMFMANKNIRNFLVFGGIMALIGFVVVLNTSFLDVFIERYEQRKLAERELGEETRFLEYQIIYNDLFVYKDYSPWFGYELMNSSGNYGKGILEDRTLHSDITNLVHSTGLVGLALYLLMIGATFLRAFRHITHRTDFLTLLFCGAAFLVYTITGRYLNIECMLLTILTLLLPLAQSIPADSVQEQAQATYLPEKVNFKVKHTA